MLSVNHIARVCHEANRAHAIESGEAPETIWPDWDNVPESIRESTRLGVKAVLDGAAPRELHDSWCAAKQADGWIYGPVRDNAKKIHPCLVSYDALPRAQQVKDWLFSAIVDALKYE